MRKFFLLFTLLVATYGLTFAETAQSDYLKNVTHMKQSTIRIQGEKTIYFDPFMMTSEPHDADIVLVTHTHGDHFSIPDLKKVMKPNAILFIPADGVNQAKAEGITDVVAVVPNKEYSAQGFKFQTVPAYNTNKTFHPKENNWVGYICKINNVTYYMAGDTDLIPEMKSTKADVVFLPVGGTYTMTAKEAADAANIMHPAVAVPIHFADVVGTFQDAKDFVSLLDKKIQGVILKNQ
jgi:L-ascorbate metabolism protein UlaG (beta-lactamase superfamily)